MELRKLDSKGGLVRAGAIAISILLFGCMPTSNSRAEPEQASGSGQMIPSKGGGMSKASSDSPAWKELEVLIREQKFEQAASRLDALEEEVRSDADGEGMTRVLVLRTQLRVALHGYETAVRDLRAAEWPEDARSRLVLGLFYGRTLMTYLGAYEWEIRQRERVATADDGLPDLRSWTVDQIRAEIQRAYSEVWAARHAWGDASIGNLGEFVEQNNYPARIRGTLRDTVSYLWLELLADPGYWSPAQSNGVYRLELEELLADAEAFDGGIEQMADPDVHPLWKMRWLLADLEAWHAANERPEAAFEARLRLIERLGASFDQKRFRSRFRRELEERSAELGRRLPWWSMGMAALAESWRMDSENPRHLIEARAVAVEGAEAHPESAGGKRCRNIVASIELPRFQLAAMALDGANRRSIEITHANLSTLFLRAYTMDYPGRIEGSTERNAFPDRRQVQQLIEKGEPVARWTVELPRPGDYRSHRTFSTPPLERSGAYLLVASAREDFRNQHNQQQGVLFVLSDLVPIQRHSRLTGELEVRVRSGRTGDAIGDAEVSLFRMDYRGGHRLEARRSTDQHGLVTFRPPADRRASYNVLVEKDGERILGNEIYGSGRPHTANDSDQTLIYTDRSVYRPGQELHFKVVVYRSEDQRRRYRAKAGQRVEVQLRDTNGEIVASEIVTTNEFGSASGTFEIPTGRLLGRWVVQTPGGGHNGIEVEEYKRPTFEVTLDSPASALRLNREAVLEGEVRYYFGLPVTDAAVSYRITREPVWPPWWGWWRPSGGSIETLDVGEVALDGEGRFEVRFTPEADENLAEEKNVSYNYRLSVDVTDDGGETRSASRSFRVGFVAVEARLDPARGFFEQGEPSEITIQRRHLDGRPAPGEGTWRLLRLVAPEKVALPADLPPSGPGGPPIHRHRLAAGGQVGGNGEGSEGDDFTTEGDRLRPRWNTSYTPEAVLDLWADGEQVAAGELRHGEDGNATVEERLEAGAYRLRYRTVDPFGAVLERDVEWVVAGKKSGDSLPLAAVLFGSGDAFEVGETARLFVGSGLPSGSALFELYRGGERLMRRELGAGPELVEIPIGAEDRGGLEAVVSVLRDHQLIELETKLEVPWTDRGLDVSFATFRDRLRPGTKETFTIRVSGQPEVGEPSVPLAEGSAEVLAYMFDRSLELFATHDPIDPISFYPKSYGRDGSHSRLGQARQIWHAMDRWHDLPRYPHLSGDRLRFFDGYGIGGPGARGGFGGPRAFGRSEMRSMKVQSMAAPMAAAMPEADMAMAEGAPGALAAAAEVEYLAADAGTGSSDPPETEGGDGLRTDFAETAFWYPHLRLGEDGSVSFEFTVPDSVTEWDVWAHASTRDMRTGSAHQSTRSVKDLLVRPYLPRFLREGDRAEVRVVVSNASDQTLEGELDFDLLDPETGADRLADFGLDGASTRGIPFAVEAGRTTTLRFLLRTPSGPGPLAVRAVARSGEHSDGELRPLPILPSRLRLAQSRFAMLREAGARTLRFEDLLAGDDPSLESESLVVTLDAQLFYSVLYSLPYLVDYPYECTEQTLNRFVSTGIVSSVFERYPSVATMAASLADRRGETILEAFDGDDPNRRMLLEESPWLRQSRGLPHQSEGEKNGELLKILDPEIARATRDRSLADLRQAQTASGAFPWWSGGPPSPFMTLYILEGLSRALDHGVEVPRDMVQRAWQYLAAHWRDELGRRLAADATCCIETVTHLNYVLSTYPDPSWTGGVFTDDDRRVMLKKSFAKWREHSPRVKGFLALTLLRAERPDDARLVWDSVMDSAKSDEDLGTYWAPEERAWLFYNDTVESQAFALRVLQELGPEDPRRHGLVQWLLLDKKLGHWKSTRATAEAIYSLVYYLEREDLLVEKERVKVSLGELEQSFVFEPETYSGARNRVVVEGPEVTSAMGEIEIEKKSRGFLIASATWHFATDRLPEEGDGDLFQVERSYFRRVQQDGEWVLQPLDDGAELAVGDQVEVQLGFSARHQAEYVHLRDPRGAGFEPEDLDSGYRFDGGLGHYREIRDSGTNFFFEWVPVGQFTLRYRLRATTAGTFRVGPAQVQSMYAPEFVAYSAGKELSIEAGAEKPEP